MKSPITTGKSKDIKVNPPSLITRARMRPPQMAKKGGQGAFSRLAPQTRNCPSRAAPAPEIYSSSASRPEYFMTSWRMSTSRPSSIAMIMSSASSTIFE